MYISPQKFSLLLKSSTLSASEQHSILNFLPSLTSEQIQEIGKLLMADAEAQNILTQNIEQNANQILNKFDEGLKSISFKDSNS